MLHSPALYDLSPLASLLGLGALIALVPLAWVMMRHRTSTPPARRLALMTLTLFLTVDLILLGAFTRLTDSGLGCPDWPGCYGSTSPLGASSHIDAQQIAMPDGPVTHKKAWIEMLHRYLATSVGGLILVSTILALRDRFSGATSQRDGSTNGGLGIVWPIATLCWVCLQGAFGALTVTMKLFPAIVSLHLLGSYVLLGMLVVQVVVGTRAAARKNGTPPSQRGTVDAGHGIALWTGLLLVLLQASSGAWVSTNYAVLVCAEFPQCQGSWWPAVDFSGALEIWRPLGLRADGSTLSLPVLTAIHMTHRLLAVLTTIYLTWLLWQLRRIDTWVAPRRALLALLSLQLITGLSNVVLDWPLLAAMLHTGGAGGLVAVLVWMLTLNRIQVSEGVR